ncbi:hypothetical protein EHZ47_21700 [Aeromonas jandaei]|nr:hypothetical protein EHZ47_21700 [Aeromonas jandaei]
MIKYCCLDPNIKYLSL